ncbi:MAG: DUF429 domain-containing protein [Chloroflexi bacterium]|nr:DUF429 domain-containing protein [Chloroflexota bacterium]
MTVFVGLDLAWTQGRPSGVCVLEGDASGVTVARLDTATLAPGEFAALVAGYGPDLVAAIDAPLVVEPGRRAEAELGRVFGRFHAGAYSANRPFLERMGGMAGTDLAAALIDRGFSLDPGTLTPGAAGRFAMEVFPHPAHIVFFGLDHIIRYKKGAIARRRQGVDEYRRRLRTYLEARTPGVLGSAALDLLMPASLDGAGGRELKAVEDTLDALTCALVAHHCWKEGTAGFEMFGCAECGHIVVPRPLPSRPATCAPARSSP